MERRGSRLSRRGFVAGAAGAGLLAGCGRLPWQDSAPVQQPDRLARIGVLSVNPRDQTIGIAGLLQGLADYGYVEGRNLSIEWHSADGSIDRLPDLAAQLVGLRPEVIVVPAAIDARIASQATSTIPIVVAGTAGDLVGAGLAVSLAYPGGNVTGLSTPSSLAGKRLQLLKETIPGLSHMAVFEASTATSVTPEGYEGYARRLGVQLRYVDVQTPEELEEAFAAATRAQVDGLYVGGSPFFNAHRGRMLALAAEHRLPAMYPYRAYVEDGGLMAYQHRINDSWRRAAYYVDRILKGAKPADLPVEQPMTFDFVVNLKTARELGITFPNEIMLQVTEVIQ